MINIENKNPELSTFHCLNCRQDTYLILLNLQCLKDSRRDSGLSQFGEQMFQIYFIIITEQNKTKQKRFIKFTTFTSDQSIALDILSPRQQQVAI